MLFRLQAVVPQCSSSLRWRSSNSVNSCLDVDELAEYAVNHSVYMTVNSAPHTAIFLYHIISLSSPSIVLRQLFRPLLAIPAGTPHARICARGCSVMVSWSVCMLYPLPQQATVTAVDFDTPRLCFPFARVYAYLHLFLTYNLFLVSLANLCALYNVK